MPGHALTEQQVEHYNKEGYLVVNSILTASDLTEIDGTICEMTDRALNGNEMSQILELEPEPVDGKRVPRRIYNPYDQHETFRKVATNPRILDPIESLIGANINLQHSKLNMKPAKVGSVVEWHQDLAYFPHTNADLVTTLIYLDEATEENGCLQVLPRHHHHFFEHSDAEGKFTGMISEDLSRFGRPIPLTAPAGSAIFMHCLTPHSSLPNRSAHPRRTLIFQYRAADSFPIWYGPMTAKGESIYRPIRGRTARYARFDGPRPLMPYGDNYTSLFELQAQSKAAMERVQP
jgi:ectoine hydroxylase-related dioxygenase (phytanoyl-CoA dioxygenase family)